MRTLSILLLTSVCLGACSTYTPPTIKYDDKPVLAVSEPALSRPVKIVEVPQPLPLPGQLKPLPSPSQDTHKAPKPLARVNAANSAAE